MREQGTLVASRLWAEEGVNRANMNERHQKRQSCASNSDLITPTLARHRARGAGVGKTRKKKNGKNRPTSGLKA